MAVRGGDDAPCRNLCIPRRRFYCLSAQKKTRLCGQQQQQNTHRCRRHITMTDNTLVMAAATPAVDRRKEEKQEEEEEEEEEMETTTTAPIATAVPADQTSAVVMVVAAPTENGLNVSSSSSREDSPSSGDSPSTALSRKAAVAAAPSPPTAIPESSSSSSTMTMGNGFNLNTQVAVREIREPIEQEPTSDVEELSDADAVPAPVTMADFVIVTPPPPPRQLVAAAAAAMAAPIQQPQHTYVPLHAPAPAAAAPPPAHLPLTYSNLSNTLAQSPQYGTQPMRIGTANNPYQPVFYAPPPTQQQQQQQSTAEERARYVTTRIAQLKARAAHRTTDVRGRRSQIRTAAARSRPRSLSRSSSSSSNNYARQSSLSSSSQDPHRNATAPRRSRTASQATSRAVSDAERLYDDPIHYGSVTTTAAAAGAAGAARQTGIDDDVLSSAASSSSSVDYETTDSDLESVTTTTSNTSREEEIDRFAMSATSGGDAARIMNKSSSKRGGLVGVMRDLTQWDVMCPYCLDQPAAEQSRHLNCLKCSRITHIACLRNRPCELELALQRVSVCIQCARPGDYRPHDEILADYRRQFRVDVNDHPTTALVLSKQQEAAAAAAAAGVDTMSETDDSSDDDASDDDDSNSKFADSNPIRTAVQRSLGRALSVVHRNSLERVMQSKGVSSLQRMFSQGSAGGQQRPGSLDPRLAAAEGLTMRMLLTEAGWPLSVVVEQFGLHSSSNELWQKLQFDRNTFLDMPAQDMLFFMSRFNFHPYQLRKTFALRLSDLWESSMRRGDSPDATAAEGKLAEQWLAAKHPPPPSVAGVAPDAPPEHAQAAAAANMRHTEELCLHHRVLSPDQLAIMGADVPHMLLLGLSKEDIVRFPYFSLSDWVRKLKFSFAHWEILDIDREDFASGALFHGLRGWALGALLNHHHWNVSPNQRRDMGCLNQQEMDGLLVQKDATGLDRQAPEPSPTAAAAAAAAVWQSHPQAPPALLHSPQPPPPPQHQQWMRPVPGVQPYYPGGPHHHRHASMYYPKRTAGPTADNRWPVAQTVPHPASAAVAGVPYMPTLYGPQSAQYQRVMRVGVPPAFLPRYQEAAHVRSSSYPKSGSNSSSSSRRRKINTPGRGDRPRRRRRRRRPSQATASDTSSVLGIKKRSATSSSSSSSTTAAATAAAAATKRT